MTFYGQCPACHQCMIGSVAPEPHAFVKKMAMGMLAHLNGLYYQSGALCLVYAPCYKPDNKIRHGYQCETCGFQWDRRYA